MASRLSGAPVEDYLLPLDWVHVFRYTPLTLLVPGQVSADLPGDVAGTIAHGDLASAVAVLVGVIFLNGKWKGSLAVAWLIG